MSARYSRSMARFESRLRKLLLRCEKLEARELLASDLLVGDPSQDDTSSEIVTRQQKQVEDRLVTLAPTHFYEVDGQEVGMVVYPNRVALSLTTETDVSALGLQFERSLNADYAVYKSIDNSTIDTQQLLASGLVRSAVPAFFVPESKSEAVLLDEIIVSLKPGVTAEDFFGNNLVFSSYERLLGTPDQFIGKVAAGTGAEALAVVNQLNGNEQLNWVAPNFYQKWQKFAIPNDPRFGNQWHLNNTGQGGGLIDADSDLPEAWNIIPGGSPELVIGIIDDSVAIDHPDLNNWVNPGEIAADSFDNDGNGWADDVNGWNFVSNNRNSQHTTPIDMHGTSVAGVAAARGDNGLGVTGASYLSKVSSARIFEGTSVASDANIAGALYYMAGRTADGLGTWDSADVVNNSWGGGANSAAINAALTWGTTQGRQGRGVNFLFATGNDYGAVSQPALQALNIPGVIAIGATNNKGTRSDYSNFGPAVDVVAPSNDLRAGYLAIDTTDRIGVDGYDPGDYTGTGANGFGGTSSATPLATGITALVIARAESMGVDLSPAQMRDYIRTNTDLIGGAVYDINTGKNLEYGYGRLNAASAVANLGGPEISVVTTTTEIFKDGSLNLGTAFVDEYIDFTLRVRNQGTSPLDMSSLSLSAGPITILSALGSPILDIGQATTFSVRFAPATGGLFTQIVTIASNDADEAAFTFQLTATGIAAVVSGMVFEDWDGDNELDSIDTLLPGSVVFVDGNNNGILDASPTNYTNTTPVNIVSTAISQIVVSGSNGPIFDVDLRINMTHTWDADMQFTLVSPTGTRVLLINQIGGSGDNFTNTVLDDEAATSIVSGAPPFTGSFRPANPLSAFDGVSANGTWTLEMVDVEPVFDSGVLQNWTLSISTAEQFVTSRPSGVYGFASLPLGTHVIRVAPPSGWSPSSPTGYTVNITGPGDSNRNSDFGIGKNNRFYTHVFNDVNTNGLWEPTEVGTPGRQLFDDVNNNNRRDILAAQTFTVSPSLAIPDLVTVVSTQTISGLTLPITDVNIRVNITHTWDSDLTATLVHPDGTRVQLFSAVGGSGDNFTNTILDDEASASITTGVAPFTGSFKPAGLLSTLINKSASGVWQLEIRDNASLDTGTLLNWSVIVETGEPVFNVGPLGTGFVDVGNGVHNVRLVSAVGWQNTIPVNGVRTRTASGAPMFDNTYGVIVANTPPTLAVNTLVASGVEGTTITNTGTWSDPNLADAITMTASVGTVVFAPNGTWTWSYDVPDNTTNTPVTITADDNAGGVTTLQFFYNASNVPPALSIGNPLVATNSMTTVYNTGTWSDVPADTVTLTANIGSVVRNADGTFTWSYGATQIYSGQTVTITGRDEDGGVNTVSFVLTVYAGVPVTRVYYKGSSYSVGGTNVTAGTDPTKTLVRSGTTLQQTTFANVTNYSKGINGVVLDVAGVLGTALTAADFTFKMSPQGNYNEAANPPSAWATAPSPTVISTSPGTPNASSTRIRVEWPDNAIENRWLQIRVVPTIRTGLQVPAVFYIGNLKAEINGLAANNLLTVTSADLAAASPAGGSGTVSNVRDVDRNGLILNSDLNLIRLSMATSSSLRLITIPIQGTTNEGSSGSQSSGGGLLVGGVTQFSTIGSGATAIGSSLNTGSSNSNSDSKSSNSGDTSANVGTGASSSSNLFAQQATGSSSGTSTDRARGNTAAPSITKSLSKRGQNVDSYFDELGTEI